MKCGNARLDPETFLLDVAQRIVSFPMGPYLQEDEQDAVVEALKA